LVNAPDIRAGASSDATFRVKGKSLIGTPADQFRLAPQALLLHRRFLHAIALSLRASNEQQIGAAFKMHIPRG